MDEKVPGKQKSGLDATSDACLQRYMDEKVPGKQKSGLDAHFSQKGFLNSVLIISYSDS